MTVWEQLMQAIIMQLHSAYHYFLKSLMALRYFNIAILHQNASSY